MITIIQYLLIVTYADGLTLSKCCVDCLICKIMVISVCLCDVLKSVSQEVSIVYFVLIVLFYQAIRIADNM